MTHSSTVSTLDLDGFVGGKSAAIVALQNLALEVACTSIPVLLVGESGTGKQVLARHIHRLAGRLDHEFLRVPCAAAKPDLFSSPISLSEHSKGAGTIFLDDIGELDVSSQRALLSALPDGDGPSASGLLSGRLISATNQNLEREIRDGRFRSELFYRISGVCLHLPPLRERKEDIPELVEFFVGKHSLQLGRPKPCISAEAMSLFAEYGWPGNIRHLENVVRSIVALGDERRVLSEFERRAEVEVPAAAPQTSSLKAAARAASRETEKELILRALKQTRWNRKRAARDLQISYKSLLHKLKLIGIEDSEIHVERQK